MPDSITHCDTGKSLGFVLSSTPEKRSVTAMEKVCPVYANTVSPEIQSSNLTKAVSNSSVSCYE